MDTSIGRRATRRATRRFAPPSGSAAVVVLPLLLSPLRMPILPPTAPPSLPMTPPPSPEGPGAGAAGKRREEQPAEGERGAAARRVDIRTGGRRGRCPCVSARRNAAERPTVGPAVHSATAADQRRCSDKHRNKGQAPGGDGDATTDDAHPPPAPGAGAVAADERDRPGWSPRGGGAFATRRARRASRRTGAWPSGHRRSPGRARRSQRRRRRRRRVRDGRQRPSSWPRWEEEAGEVGVCGCR